ncbi:MAG: FAD-dependent oxidoreductase [Planctomycetota bacterium]|nr:FAD-dependent oxidoreductase [Planctomycetota bacterium]
MKPFDLMLCGGGVIGLSIAYQCAQHGWKVLVVDSMAMGQAASWAGAGILPAGATIAALDPLEQLRSLSHLLHRDWSKQLLVETGIDNEYRQCGGVYLARTAAERATLSANRMWWDEHGIRYESWSNDQLVARIASMESIARSTPNLQSWFCPDDCRLRNPSHLQALIQACEKRGVTLIEQARIDGFETSQNRIISAKSGSQEFRADRYCITSGAWASQLLGPLGIETGILPVRGQMVLYQLDKPAFTTVINDGHRYLVPRDDGHVLAGSCEEEVGFDATTTDSMIADLQSWAEALCPALTSANIKRTWAGLRPGSFDTYPYLGTLHPMENGFIASGHFRHGLHWSTATALLMYQWMNGDKTEIDLMPFRVQRGRSLGK